MKNEIIGRRWSITWRGHTEPPDGLRVLCWIYVPGKNTRMPAEIEQFPLSRGSGYFVTHQAVMRPAKRLSPEQLARVRRQRLEHRLNAKAPLFKEFFVEEAMARKPAYYEGVIDADRQAAIEQEAVDFLEIVSRPNEFVVLAQEPEEAKRRAAEVRAEIEAAVAAARAKRLVNAAPLPTLAGEGSTGA
jgi:hypothetical protein